MAKDPAFLFYPNDWQGGTMTLTRHLKGCYMDLLMAQFNLGHLSLEEIRIVLGSDFSNAWEALRKKFAQDATGKFFNERLEEEVNKRKSYCESRRKNKSGNTSPTHVEHMLKHMESENENENENEIKGGVGGLPPSQSQIEEIFSSNGLTSSEGENFFRWVNGTKGWDKINDWRDYTAAVIAKKLIEKQNKKNGNNDQKKYGAAPTVQRGTKLGGL